nr:hypothetical protein [Tanacetum cinerariifolium]
MTPSTIATITTISHAPIPPTIIPSEVLQNLPTFDSVFRFDDRLKSLETNFSEYRQTSPFAKAVSNIPADKTILDSYGETIILKRRRDDDDDDQEEEPSVGSDRGSKRRREAVQGSTQTWISELAKQADSRSSFNELLDTPLDFSNFIMNRVRVDTLTPELLAGPTYELMKGSCTSLIELEYHLEEVYKATTDQLDWVNPEATSSIFGEVINYDKHALWGVSHWGRKRQRRVKDLQLGVESYQKRLNLTKPDTDGTLNDVRNALDDRLKGIRMQYLPQRIWRKGDKDRAATMIQAIDMMLKTRRIMRSLERFVGGRLYEGDFRILQRTI